MLQYNKLLIVIKEHSSELRRYHMEKEELKQEIIEGIIPESNSHRKVCKEIKKILAQELKNLTSLTKFELVKRRKERYRKF